MSNPLFSVILPTRNRGELLRRAIASVLWQTFDDFELVVFDNGSEDDTPQIVKEFSDPRLRFERSATWIAPQGSFEEAFKIARGEFFHVIGDDDALFPHCLQRAKDVLDKHSARIMCFSTKCFYYYPDWVDDAVRNSIMLSKFTADERIMASKAELASLFDFRFSSYRHPNVTNSFFRKQDVVDIMESYGGILLDDQMGDISIAAFLLNLTNEYLFLDEPLQVAGCSGRSNSANQMIMERSVSALNEEFRAWFSNKEKMARFLDGVPIKIPFWFNFQTSTLLRQKVMLGLSFDVNWVNYFKKMWRALVRLERRGVNIMAEKEEFCDALSKQDLLTQFQVKFYVTTRRKKRNKTLIPNRKNDDIIHGKNAGFTDIITATAYTYDRYINSVSRGPDKR